MRLPVSFFVIASIYGSITPCASFSARGDAAQPLLRGVGGKGSCRGGSFLQIESGRDAFERGDF